MIDIADHQTVFSPLVSAYHERGYQAGYARGMNDALTAALESTEDFIRLQPNSAADPRQLLYAFSEFLEQRVGGKSPDLERGFVDGLGI
jgi:hypothetical protein